MINLLVGYLCNSVNTLLLAVIYVWNCRNAVNIWARMLIKSSKCMEYYFISRWHAQLPVTLLTKKFTRTSQIRQIWFKFFQYNLNLTSDAERSYMNYPWTSLFENDDVTVRRWKLPYVFMIRRRLLQAQVLVKWDKYRNHIFMVYMSSHGLN